MIYTTTQKRSDILKLIVGLGNPGREYNNTRHNIGFMCIDKIAEYFRINFPITAKLMKIEKEKNGIAEIILIKAGKKHGIKVEDKFNVEVLEILDGEILPTTLGIATVTALKGEAYAECKVSKKEGKAIYENFNANKQIKCSLIIK